jgi:hypothetical protein
LRPVIERIGIVHCFVVSATTDSSKPTHRGNFYNREVGCDAPCPLGTMEPTGVAQRKEPYRE